MHIISFYDFSHFFVCVDLGPVTALNSVPTLTQEFIRNCTLTQCLMQYATAFFRRVFKGKPPSFHKTQWVGVEANAKQGYWKRRGRQGQEFEVKEK